MRNCIGKKEEMKRIGFGIAALLLWRFEGEEGRHRWQARRSAGGCPAKLRELWDLWEESA